MPSVSFLIVFIGLITVLSAHSVVWWHNIQGTWVLGSRDILSVMISISCCHGVGCLVHSKGVKQSLQGWLSVVSGHVYVAVVVQVIGGESHLPGNGCSEHCWVGFLLCIMRGFVKHCWWDPVSDQVSTWFVYWQVSSTVQQQGLSSQHQCKGTECCEGVVCTAFPR